VTPKGSGGSKVGYPSDSLVSCFNYYYCAIVIVVTVFICTCFLFCIANLLFSCAATQPQVWNNALCVCGLCYIQPSNATGVTMTHLKPDRRRKVSRTWPGVPRVCRYTWSKFSAGS